MTKTHVESHLDHPGPLNVFQQPEVPSQVSLLLFNPHVMCNIYNQTAQINHPLWPTC